jgi:hypothetical protein
MSSVILNIANGSPQPLRQINLFARIGNEEQECDGGYETGGPTAAGRYFAATLAAANALAVSVLDCLPPEAFWYAVSQDYVISGSEEFNTSGWETFDET